MTINDIELPNKDYSSPGNQSGVTVDAVVGRLGRENRNSQKPPADFIALVAFLVTGSYREAANNVGVSLGEIEGRVEAGADMLAEVLPKLGRHRNRR